MTKSIYILIGILFISFLIGGVCGYFLKEKIHKCPVVVVKKDTVRVRVPVIEVLRVKGDERVIYKNKVVHDTTRNQYGEISKEKPDSCDTIRSQNNDQPATVQAEMGRRFLISEVDSCWTMEDSSNGKYVYAEHCLPSNTWDVRASQPDIVFTDSTRTIVEKVIETTGVSWLWVPVAIVFGIIAVAESVTALTK